MSDSGGPKELTLGLKHSRQEVSLLGTLNRAFSSVSDAQSVSL